jgi:hypothetical protein
MGLCAARSIGHDFLSSNSYFNHYKIPNISAVVSYADNDFRIISSHKLLHEKLCVSETPWRYLLRSLMRSDSDSVYQLELSYQLYAILSQTLYAIKATYEHQDSVELCV